MFKPKQAAEAEDEDLFGSVDDVVAYYNNNPPKRIRIGSDWQIYSWLMFCHWFTVLGMIILLAVAFSTGAITRSE